MNVIRHHNQGVQQKQFAIASFTRPHDNVARPRRQVESLVGAERDEERLAPPLVMREGTAVVIEH
jgi:hypothetical protein